MRPGAKMGATVEKRPRFLGLLCAITFLAIACDGASPSDPGRTVVTPSESATGVETFAQSEIVTSAQAPPGSDLRLARRESIKFDRLSLPEGLSHGTVMAIAQDRTGLMWFATEDGLSKYDGYTFTVFRPDPERNSLSHTYVWALYQDRDGVLWLGTLGAGLDRFDPSTEQFTNYRSDPRNRYSLSNNFVSAILEDSTGTLWVGTMGGGLNKFDRKSGRFTRYWNDEGDPFSISDNTVWTLYEDRSGLLWVGTNRGLNCFDRDRERFVRYSHRPDDPHSLSNDIVQSIVEDREGALWVGTLGGLNKLEPETYRFSRYLHDAADPDSLSHDSVEALYTDRDGVLWIGTADGLDRFEYETQRFIHYRYDPSDPASLSSSWIKSIFEDREGVLWIGTYVGGLNKVGRSTERFAHYKTDPYDANSLSGNVVWSLHEDRDGVLWIGTNGQGLNKFDRATGSFTHYRHDPNDPATLNNDVVRSIFPDGEGGLWIGTDGGGLEHFDPESERFIHYQHDPQDPRSLNMDRVRVVYVDREGRLWVGTRGGGLDLFDQGGGFIHYTTSPDSPRPLTSNTIWALYQDRQGIFWVGTIGGGLNMADRDRGRYRAFQHDPNDPSSLSENSVLSIFEDHTGVLWIGTYGGGLNRFDRDTETFTHYRTTDGLPNDVVYGILEDDVPPDQGGPFLWISTNDGLSRFNPRTETFWNFDTSDGLQSDAFNVAACYKSSSGEMFFGGINGFNAFFPDRVIAQHNPYLPPVVLTSLTQGGEPLELDGAVESVKAVNLNWPNNHFEFEFAALSFTSPEENRYAYMLEGFDKGWNNVGARRFGTYTNLPGGAYTLRIKGSNNDGLWNDKGASITVTVLPPFWDTLWFRGSVALALIGLVVGVYRQRVKNIEARSRELERLVQQRTTELRQEIDQRMQVEEALRQSEMEQAVAAERNRLARELHDAVSQTLFSASLIAEALPDIGKTEPEAVGPYLNDLQQLNRGALAEMRTLLLELRPAALVDTDLRDLLRQLADAVRGREGIPVTVTAEPEGDLPADVHVALYRIAQEALNNVVKHARASHATVSLGCVFPAARTDAGGVELCVTDDGRGFDLHNVPPDHLGLSIMRERAEAIGATFEISSKPGAGTRVKVVWPMDTGHKTEDEENPGAAL